MDKDCIVWLFFLSRILRIPRHQDHEASKEQTTHVLRHLLEQLLWGDVGRLNEVSYHICAKLERREGKRKEQRVASSQPATTQTPINWVRE